MRSSWLVPLVLLAAPVAAQAAPPSVEVAGDEIVFKAGNEVVGRYHIGKSVAKPFLWPVNAPGGVPVTRAWPMDKNDPGNKTTDHVHQKSAWFCHGDVIPEGIELKTKSSDKRIHAVDFWSENKGHGTIVCVKKSVAATAAKGPAEVLTWNEWRTADGMKIIDEERTITFHDLPEGRLFVFECKLTASVCPITFGDTKEGSFGVRVHDALMARQPDGGTVTAADGTAAKAPAKDNLPMWGKYSDWHDYSGKVNGKAVGVAVFDHPKNPSRALWHTRAYGLLAANPFGRDDSGFPAVKGKTDLVRIEKGKSLTFVYGLYAHTGDATSGKVAEVYETFKK
jgi:hypothetical protein